MERGLCTITVLLMAVYCVLGCSKLERGARVLNGEDEDERKVYYSKVVVYGNIGENVTGNYPFKDVAGVYTVEFEVVCTYLGGPVSKKIYISGIGNENSEIEGCPAAPVGTSKDAVMFLKPTETRDVYEVEFAPNVGAYDIMLDDLTFVCGLSLYNGSEVCDDFPPMTEEEDCQPFIPDELDELEPTPDPTKGTTKSVIAVEIDPKAESNSNGNINQSDQGYDTKTDKAGAPVDASKVHGEGGSAEGGSAIVTSSILLTVLNMLLAIIV